MALFSFGKKDKNTTQDPDSVGKAITPPKIQTPPAEADPKSVMAPQPAGLTPGAGKLPAHAGVATTQPIIVPRGGVSVNPALRPSRPTNQVRSTQRIVLPPVSGLPKGGRASITAPINAASNSAFGGNINLPLGMILRSLPEEVLAGNISQFEASGAAAQEVSLPMNVILSQVPSGKIELSIQDLLQYVPQDYVQPAGKISGLLSTLVVLPLMDVVMRIPPDLLALRSDQKEVDASVTSMPDPFTEEILREQANQANQEKENAAKIIEESQVPATGEEFVPSAKTTSIPFRPTPPTSPKPPGSSKITQVTPAPRPTVTAPMPTTPPMPSVAKLPTPPTISRSGGLTPPASTGSGGASTARIPMPPLRPTDPSGKPTRSTAPVPSRAAAPKPSSTATTIVAPPAPTPPRPPTALPPVARAPLAPPAPPVPTLPPVKVATPPTALVPSLSEPPPATEELNVEAPPVPETPVPSGGDAGSADELQRLAALAMAALGDDVEEGAESQAPPTTQVPLPPVMEEPALPPAPVSAPAVAPAPNFSFPAAPAAAPAKPLAPAGFKFNAPVPASTPSAAPVIPRPAPKAASPPIDFKLPTSAAAAQVPEKSPVASMGGHSPVAFNLNTCTADELSQIPGCSPHLAEAIIEYRSQVGVFRKLEDLLNVPGVTKETYALLTGESPEAHQQQTINELLGFPIDQKLTPKDVTERICCWPDVSGCVLGQSSGLLLVGHVPPPLDKDAVVAFAPKMFESLNKSFSEISGRETDELILPTPEISYHILRRDDLYLIILSRLRQMPSRHLKVARFVLANLNVPT